MSTWPRYPTIYEINTWVWLAELSAKAGRSVDLGSVPSAEWDSIAAYGFDAVWLMGVWERSPAGISIANRNQSLLADFRRALPDFRPEDNVGSPYCIRGYVIDQHLGGRAGLAQARQELARRNVRLLLDFVPNHVAPDHPWAREHPEYFVHGTTQDLQSDPSSYIQINQVIYACGKDPYFPAWPDVLQLNAFEFGLRKAVAETLLDIASQCDGVRCDMAMLLLNSVFERTWGSRAGSTPPTEYWVDVILRSSMFTRTSASSLKPIGTWNGSCNRRALISATTRGSTIAWSMTTQKALAFISALIWRTRKSCCASSKIMTSPGQHRYLHRQESGPLLSRRLP